MDQTALAIADTLEAEARILVSAGLPDIAKRAIEEARQWRWMSAVDNFVEGTSRVTLSDGLDGKHGDMPVTQPERVPPKGAPGPRRSAIFRPDDKKPEQGSRDQSAHRLYTHYYEDLLS